MPAIYAHKSLADKVFEKLDNNIKDIILKHKDIFLLGALGPDPLFYYRPLKGLPLYKKASAIHDIPIYDLLKNYKITSDADLCYLLGFITHYVLDKNTHEYIPTIECDGYSHVKLESELEKYLIRDDGLKSRVGLFTKHLVLININVDFMNKILDVSLDTYNKAIKGMRFCTKFFMSNDPLKKGIAKLALRLSGQYNDTKDIFLLKKDDIAYRDKVLELQKIFIASIDETVLLINNFYNYLSSNIELSSRFKKKY